MNTGEEIDAVRRWLTGTSEAHEVVLERTFDADVAELWGACTRADRLALWFETVRGELAPGGRFTLEGSGTQGDVLQCERPRLVSISWEYGGDVSHIDIELVPTEDDRTVLRLTHHCPPGAHWERYGPAATGVGWEESLRALSLHLLDGGRGVSAEMEAIAATPEGRELTRRSAAAWGEADHLAGTAAEVATARALRTASFYLGEA